MKIRSHALFAYLQDAGVLHDTPEAISAAKAEYRKQYKKAHKQRQRPRKEIRFEVSLKQYQTIKTAALQNDMKVATYVRYIALKSVGECIVDHRLLEVLQLVSMATNIAIRDNRTQQIYELLTKAENRLLALVNQ